MTTFPTSLMWVNTRHNDIETALKKLLAHQPEKKTTSDAQYTDCTCRLSFQYQSAPEHFDMSLIMHMWTYVLDGGNAVRNSLLVITVLRMTHRVSHVDTNT